MRTFRVGMVEVKIGIYSNTAVTRDTVINYLESLENEGWRLPGLNEIEYIQSLYGIKGIDIGINNQGDYWIMEEQDFELSNCYDMFFCIKLKKEGNEIAGAIFVR
jgi:hypothetical protein